MKMMNKNEIIFYKQIKLFIIETLQNHKERKNVMRNFVSVVSLVSMLLVSGCGGAFSCGGKTTPTGTADAGAASVTAVEPVLAEPVANTPANGETEVAGEGEGTSVDVFHPQATPALTPVSPLNPANLL